MTAFPPVDTQLRELEQGAAWRADHQRRLDEADPNLAQRITNLASAYGWMRPGVVWSLGKAGQDVGGQTALNAARRSAIVRSRTGFASYGEPVATDQIAASGGPRLIPTRGDVESGHNFVTASEAKPYAKEDWLWNLGLQLVQADEQIPGRGTAESGADWRPLAHYLGIPTHNRADALDAVRKALPQDKAQAIHAAARQAATRSDIARARGSGDPLLQTAGVGGGLGPGIVRGFSTVLAAPLQEITGLFRAAVSDPFSSKVPMKSQSDLGIALEHRLHHEPVDLGSGYMVDPESDVAKERVKREKSYGTIGGHAITPGRWLANEVSFAPGSKPFTVLSGLTDLAVSLKADPTILALNKVGAVQGLRNVVDPDKADAWLAGPAGRKVIDYLTGESDFHTMWTRTGKKIPVDVLNRLVDAKTPDEVTNVLRQELGTSVREFPSVAREAPSITKKGYARILGMMPSTRWDLDNLDDTVEQVDRYARNAKLHTDRIAHYTGRMARSGGSRHEQYSILTDLTAEVGSQMTGIPKRQIKRLTQIWRDSEESLSRYYVDELGNNVDFPGAVADGVGTPKADPHLFSEVLGRHVEMPDAREIRRVLSPLRPILENPAIHAGESVMNFLVQRLWKDSVLMRGAYTLRVVAEEQFRMAAAGLESMVRHPLSYFSYVVGRKGGEDLLGNVWKDSQEYRDALVRGSAGFRDPVGFHSSRHWTVYDIDHEHYVPSWADEISQLAADPIAPRIARGEDLDQLKEWFYSGAGQKLRKDLMLNDRFAPLADRAGSDGYIDSVVQRLHAKTAGDTRLMEAVATGKLNGARLTHDGMNMSREFVHELQGIYDEGVNAGKVKGRLLDRDFGDAVGERYNRAMEWIFGHLMTNQTNRFSRSKAFEQFYWQRVGELSPYMSEQARALAADQARNLGLGKVATQIESATRSGTLNGEHVDLLAKGFGLDQTRNLLYDITDRSQAFDVLRYVFPFGEAYKEMITRWVGNPITMEGGLFTQHPTAIRRLQQGVVEARSSGFFYHDPQTGQEIFSYPFSGLMNEHLLGQPIPLVGRVQGLSLMTEVLPGLGPMVQVPASYIIPDTPDWDYVRSLALPFGGIQSPSDLRGWAPPFMQKFLTDLAPTGEQQRLYANTVKDMSNYLLSTGKYKVHGPDAEHEINRLMHDSKLAAKKLYLVRGFAQFFAPSAPSPQEIVRDRDGNVRLLAEITKDWTKMLQGTEGDTEKATQQFLGKYGEDLFAVMQPKSYAVIFGVPMTKDGINWTRSNPSVQRRFPNTYGYFAPTTGDFSFDAYRRSFESGAKATISPEQWLGLANHRLASYIYNTQKDKVGDHPSDEQRRWLADLKDALKTEYPGYERPLGLPQRAEAGQLVDELKRAERDPTVARTDAGQALSLYLKARGKAEAISLGRGYQRSSFAQAQGMRDVRDWLREIGAALVGEHPGFSNLWDGVLNRELNDDTQNTEQAAA